MCQYYRQDVRFLPDSSNMRVINVEVVPLPLLPVTPIIGALHTLKNSSVFEVILSIISG